MNYNNNLNDIIQNISLDGTNINDLPKINLSPRKSEPINKNILKSITNEIINNLKDSSLEGESIDDSKKELVDNDIDGNLDDIIDEEEIINENINKKKKKKDNMQNLEDNTSIKNNKNILSYLFDDNFAIKDFILLFSIYFILSQDMVKDLFSNYFTCLNPDDEGKVGIKGVIVYGLILTIIFMISKKYLL
jgi:hypothetical protein